MRPLFAFEHRFIAGALVGALLSIANIPGAEAHPAARPIVLEGLPTSSPDRLPLDVLRLVAREDASRGDPVVCTDLRRCVDLDLLGRAVDLDGDGSKEWLVTDLGYTGTGAELDYVFQKGADKRWKMIGRVEDLHLMTVGPTRTRGFLDIHGFVTGVCVEGRGKALWNGRKYVTREGRIKSHPC